LRGEEAQHVPAQMDERLLKHPKGRQKRQNHSRRQRRAGQAYGSEQRHHRDRRIGIANLRHRPADHRASG